MSLDIYLVTPAEVQVTDAKIFIREDGQTKEISLEEWRRRFPGRESFMCEATESGCVYSANITHKVSPMWSKAGVYDAFYMSDGKKAAELIETLEKGVQDMQDKPNEYIRLNPPNGWGSYGGALEFLRGFTAACKAYPDATVEVSK